ncbi:unnamed protein product [Fraxinus pennsylvanica]|uniref:Uncharacterized protein n=1 Tax=Fraxinus pennsylvanica TaxID=56036 RepID=A0AAD2EFT6_9LAMI|nr:unnamed protein product [Fraxinus pennsylvanica]
MTFTAADTSSTDRKPYIRKAYHLKSPKWKDCDNTCDRSDIFSNLKNKRDLGKDNQTGNLLTLQLNGSSQENLSYTGLSKGSPTGSVECTELHLRNLQTHSLIDLYFPQVSPDLENGVLTTEIIKEEDDRKIKPDNHSSMLGLECVYQIRVSSKEQPSMNLRRQSTKNRPLTARLLDFDKWTFVLKESTLSFSSSFVKLRSRWSLELNEAPALPEVEERS